MTSASLLTRNVVWNMVGRVLPFAVGLVSIPPLIDSLGMDGFGLLSIAWMVVGYFSFFDMGVGKSLAKIVAEKLAKNLHNQIAVLAWSGQVLILILGVTGCLVAWVATPLIVDALNVNEKLRQEAYFMFHILSLSIPFVVSASGFRGILSAYQRFDLINKIQIPLGAWMFLGPFMVLPFSNSLPTIVAVLVIGRIIALVAYLFNCWHASNISDGFRVQLSAIKSILSLGGWISVSNIVGPVMTYMDRFFIGAWISVAAVSYYTVPYEVVTKLSIFPQAMMGVLFPAFSFALANDHDKAVKLINQSLKYLLLFVFPSSIFVIIFAREILQLWIGEGIALRSEMVMQLLAIGVLLNAPAHVAFSVIQAKGKAQWTAYVHLAELPLYLIGLWWMAMHHGVIGVALMWSTRVFIDTALLFYLMYRLIPHLLEKTMPIVSLWLALIVAGLLAMVDTNFARKTFFFILLVSGFGVIMWGKMLSAGEKSWIVSYIGKSK